jgi:hypothetical protein
MAWNMPEYNRGVEDALATAARTSIVDLIFQYTKLGAVGEYRVGWERGIRRYLIDKGEAVRCAEFVLMTEAREPVWRFINALVKDEKARWIPDPHVRGVVGLKSSYSKGNDVLMVVWLEDGDFEESLQFCEMLDDAGVPAI